MAGYPGAQAGFGSLKPIIDQVLRNLIQQHLNVTMPSRDMQDVTRPSGDIAPPNAVLPMLITPPEGAPENFRGPLENLPSPGIPGTLDQPPDANPRSKRIKRGTI